MAETSAIPLIVYSRHQEAVEIINSTLRNAGHPVHCAWVRDLAAFGDALAQGRAQLIFVCLPDAEDAAPVMELRDRQAAAMPVVLVRDTVSEDGLTRALELGARDVVTLKARPRLRAVAERELHLARLDTALAGTLASAHQYRDQMRAFMAGSTDAILHVQEGIVVDANPAWIELTGLKDAAAIVGQPLMDAFTPASHAALKGALVATAQGKWSDHSLKATAVLPGGGEMLLALELERFDFDGEPAVRIKVPTQRHDSVSITQQLAEALKLDTGTGLLKRSAFLETGRAQLAQPLKGGLRAVLYLEPDKLAALDSDPGPLALEVLLDSVGAMLREQLQPGDIGGRLTGRGYAVLIERGNTRDLDAFIRHLVERVAGHVFQVGERSLSITASAGAALCAANKPLPGPLNVAIRSQRAAAAAGGNRTLRQEDRDESRAEAEADRTWAHQIKSALMANRFRLVQQPIASLVGEDRSMFDLVVRMLDERGQEVLPSEFLTAASRTDLMKNIDRWVVGAAMSFCAARKPHKVFVRLSRDSLRDETLATWLEQQLKASRIEPSHVVIQVSEELATRHLKEAKALQQLLARLGFEFAVENYGSGRDPGQLLSHVPVNYVKIDGSLMQGLANDRPLQERVKALVEQARERSITTIAERVEDANTMAVLWQLGIEFIQGYFVNSPEEVVLGN
ncbi:MAG TPA: EAL domain-containing protein [Steroidobacteraceae bacterium]|jgi:EAL domain-containing protein (putative c-di-GMP-specific phosphodiesterase class I)/GGDEF domain-containing protein/PAS domain-containing protein|nr:EAL domain-containing protein [Steroidobacteraceae bacterium]